MHWKTILIMCQSIVESFITYDSRGVDVVRVVGVDHGIENDSVVVVGKLVRITVLLLVLSLCEGEKLFNLASSETGLAPC